jgi:hypothetical protein
VLVRIDTNAAKGEVMLLQSAVDGEKETILGGVTYVLQP